MLSLVLWMLGLGTGTGLRIGPSNQNSVGQGALKAPLLFLPNLKNMDEEDETDGARGLTVKSNFLSLFKKQLKCIDVGHLPIPNECGKYMDCVKAGVSQTSRYCPTGQLFDHLQRECVPGSGARCRGLCRHEGEEYADPKNPGGYFICRSGVPTSKKCPEGKHFKAASGHCEDVSEEANEADESSEEEDE